MMKVFVDGVAWAINGAAYIVTVSEDVTRAVTMVLPELMFGRFRMTASPKTAPVTVTVPLTAFVGVKADIAGKITDAETTKCLATGISVAEDVLRAESVLLVNTNP